MILQSMFPGLALSEIIHILKLSGIRLLNKLFSSSFFSIQFSLLLSLELLAMLEILCR